MESLIQEFSYKTAIDTVSSHFICDEDSIYFISKECNELKISRITSRGISKIRESSTATMKMSIQESSEVVSFRLSPITSASDSTSLELILSTGEIYLVDTFALSHECIGLLQDQTILASKPSPDDQLLILVTSREDGERKSLTLILMTNEFDTVSEVSIAFDFYRFR